MIRFAVVAGLAASLVAGAALADGRLPGPAQPEVVFEDGVGASFLFPVAGSVDGVNGARFRTEVTIVNFKDDTQEVLVEFLPRGGSAPSVHRIILDGRKFRFWDDFVATELGRPGLLGALTFRAVFTGTTVSDDTARLNAFARIWTQIPDSNGTSSISLPAVFDADLGLPGDALESAFIIGLRQDAQYRTNIGIVNLENFDRTFRVEPSNSVPSNPAPSFNVLVRARSMDQVAMPAGYFGGVTFKVTPLEAGRWSAYAASVDNYSGDGWVSRAQYSTPRP